MIICFYLLIKAVSKYGWMSVHKTINFIINHKDSRMRLLRKKLIPQFQQLALSQIIRFREELDYSVIRENNKILCYYDNKRI